jgi:hypothetical protein
MSERLDVQFLKVKWHVNRWGKGDPKPLFTIYIFANRMERQMAAGDAGASGPT